MLTEKAPAVMGTRYRAALNRVRTIQQPFRTHVSTGLLPDHIGCCAWILASVLP